MPANDSEALTIRSASSGDAAAIAAIYNHYISESVATFEEEPVEPADMTARIDAVQRASLPWLVCEDAGAVVGYAFATPWKARSAYRYSAEISVYLDPSHTARGIGSRLYSELLPALEASGIHAAMGGITLPNAPSVALHEKFGLTKVAHFKDVGFKFNRWIDVGYWQRVF